MKEIIMTLFGFLVISFTCGVVIMAFKWDGFFFVVGFIIFCFLLNPLIKWWIKKVDDESGWDVSLAAKYHQPTEVTEEYKE